MQRTMQFLMYAVMCTFGASIARSQGITIDTNDVKSMYAVGTTITYRNDSLTTSANIGAPGNTLWNFGGLNTNATEVKKSFAVTSTPYAAQFPQATHAFRDTALSYSFYYDAFATTITLKGIGFYYYGLRGDLVNLGRQGDGFGYLFGAAIPAQGKWIFSPAAVDYSLPLQLSKTWTTDFTETISGTYTLGVPTAFGPIITTHSITNTVDAYGTLTLPLGRMQEALRIRKVDRYVSGTTSAVRVGYIFLAKNGASVQLTVTDTSAISGIVGVNSVQWTNPTSTDVLASAEKPATFGLDQNYPNPFNPSTTIGYRVPGDESRNADPAARIVKLVVYDVLGQEVAVLVNEQKPAGTYAAQFTAANLASGVYLYRLTAGSFVDTRRMLLVR